MTELNLNEIKRDLDAVPPPPWRWIGRKETGPLLVTDHSGQLYLLGPAHPVDEHGWPMTDDEDVPIYADLMFRDERDGEDRYPVMRRAAEMIVPRTSYDPATYRDIDNPVARWIVRSAEHAAALVAEVERLRGRIAELEGDDDGHHVIDLRDDGWTIKHPLSCRPNLFDCPVNKVAQRDLTEPPAERGQRVCSLDADGHLLIGEEVTGNA